MTRADLIDVNARVIHAVGEAVKSSAPNAIVIVVTNPLDEMTVEMLRATGFPRERVLGMAGTLDSSRFRNALAMAAGVTPADVSAITLGSHGDEMAPITSLARIKGRRLERFLSDEQISACVQDAITGGGQVVAIKKSGSATIAPAHSSIELMDHIRGAKTGPVPVSVMLQGEYGVSGVVLGVPAHLGATGLVSVEELRLAPDETRALHSAAEAIRTRLGL
jgi:malate dehydrogenase